MIIETDFEHTDHVYVYYNGVALSGAVEEVRVVVTATTNISYKVQGEFYDQGVVKATKAALITLMESEVDSTATTQKSSLTTIINALPEGV